MIYAQLPVTWEVELTRDGMFPFPWRWKVVMFIGGRYERSRQGDALTKDRAHRKAAAAKISMTQDDVILR